MNYESPEVIGLLPIPTSYRPARERAHIRTIELARLAGRKAHQIRQADYEQAKREITGETDLERQLTVFARDC